MHSDRKAGVLLAMCVLTAFAGAQLSMVNSIPPNVGFVDISATGGTPLLMFDDSVQGITTTVGNALFPAGDVLIGNNGVMIAGLTSGFVDFTNGSLPGAIGNFVTNLGDAYLFPFWDDLQPISGTEATTVYWQEVAGVLYVMWKDEGHFGQVAGQTVTFEVQVFSNPPPCGPSIQYLYVDTTFGGSQAGFDGGASATIGYFGNGPLNPSNIQWSFNAPAVAAGNCLSVVDQSAGLVATSPLGAGSLQLNYGASVCTAPSASYILAATLNQGTFPNGWLAGVDIPVSELMNEISIGAPFVGVGGAFQIGPFSGLPAVTVYAVVLRFNAMGVIEGHSNAVGHPIP